MGKGLIGWSVAAAGLALAACTSTTPPATPVAAPLAGVVGPAGSGCGAEITRFQTVLQSDVATGNVARSVYDRAAPDLTRARTACDLGRDAEARSIIAATKSRFGYP